MPDPLVDVIAGALIESPVIPRGAEPYPGWSFDLAEAVAAAVRSRLLEDDVVEAAAVKAAYPVVQGGWREYAKAILTVALDAAENKP